MRTLFRILIFFFPTQLALHFWPYWSFVSGIRVDYLSPAIYFTDILLVSWSILFICNNLQLVRVKLSKQKLAVVIYLAIFFANVIFAYSPPAAMFGWITLTKLICFTWLVSLSETNFEKDILVPLSLSLILICVVGVIQFAKSSSMGGMLYFFGERNINMFLPGIATQQFLGKTYLRAYSVFSHPNSLAGYVAVCLFFLGIYVKRNKKYLYKLAFLLGVLALLLTFSLNAILSSLLACMFWKVVSRNDLVFAKPAFLVIMTITCLGILLPLFSSAYLSNPTLSFSSNVEDRLELAVGAGRIISNFPLAGVGLKNYVIYLPNTALDSKLLWSLQPVHNITLLILSETGLMGILFAYYIIFRVVRALFYKSLSDYVKYFVLLLIVIFLTGFNDHYWLTLQQNQLLFALVLGILFNTKINFRNEA